MGEKICVKCGDEFIPPRGNGYLKTCGTCTYEKYRVYKIAYRYGITEDKYLEMYAAQGGRCKICGIHESELPKRLCVDHDHRCCSDRKACGNCVRGLLCHKCNSYLGYFEDDPERLIAAYQYLKDGG